MEFSRRRGSESQRRVLRRGSQKGGFRRSYKAETRLSDGTTPFAYPNEAGRRCLVEGFVELRGACIPRLLN